jgi:hypothetical protein
MTRGLPPAHAASYLQNRGCPNVLSPNVLSIYQQLQLTQRYDRCGAFMPQNFKRQRDIARKI